MNNMRLSVAPAALVCVVAGALNGPVPRVSAESWITYDASFGTLPETQCWTRGEDINPPMSYPVGVRSGDLHLSTLGFGNNVPENNGGGVWWQRSDVTIDFASDFAAEVNVRIASAPDHSVNTVTGWPRPGYTLAVYDVHGRIFWIGLGSNEVFLSNTAFGQYESPNTVTTAFNTTDGHHLYRIERAAGGVGAALRIDGVLKLELPALGPVEGASALVYFGDPTYWANSESYTAMARFTGIPACPADINCSGTVNIDDLLGVINAWGPCPNPDNCPTDIAPGGGNDVVNIDDLLAVINAWGPCP